MQKPDESPPKHQLFTSHHINSTGQSSVETHRPKCLRTCPSRKQTRKPATRESGFQHLSMRSRAKPKQRQQSAPDSKASTSAWDPANVETIGCRAQPSKMKPLPGATVRTKSKARFPLGKERGLLDQTQSVILSVPGQPHCWLAGSPQLKTAVAHFAEINPSSQPPFAQDEFHLAVGGIGSDENTVFGPTLRGSSR